MSADVSAFPLALDVTAPALPAWELVRSARRTLAIHVRLDGRVQVRAPLRMPRLEIEDFVASRADWIRRHVSDISARPLPLAWGEGRCWWHGGEALPVRCVSAGQKVPGMTARTAVCLHEGVLWMSARYQGQPERIHEALQQWQTRLAAEVLPARVDTLVADLCRDWGSDLQPVGLRLRRMRSRWGSCSRDRRITLNTQLLHVPSACLDYVICHELSHLREFNHGPQFYAWQQHLCPDWRACRAEMKQWAERLRTS